MSVGVPVETKGVGGGLWDGRKDERAVEVQKELSGRGLRGCRTSCTTVGVRTGREEGVVRPVRTGGRRGRGEEGGGRFWTTVDLGSLVSEWSGGGKFMC